MFINGIYDLHKVHHNIRFPSYLAHQANWLVHFIASSAIHGMIIYEAIFSLLFGVSLGEAPLMAAFGVGMAAGGWWLCLRSRVRANR